MTAGYPPPSLGDEEEAREWAHRVLTDTPNGLAGTVLDDVAAERARQDARWGDQSHHPDGTGHSTDRNVAEAVRALTDRRAATGKVTWRDILNEEVREAFAESDPQALRAELVQVAAVACAWAEALDRRAGAS